MNNLKKKNFLLFIGLALSLSLLSSCDFKDPTKEFIESAKQIYASYLAKNPDGDKNVYYYDGESSRCVVFSPKDGVAYEYLGLLNFSTLKFSDNKNYVFDLGNLNIEISTDSSGTLSFKIPNYMDDSGNISISSFLKEPPFVLIYSENDEKTMFSGIDSLGNIIEDTNVDKYDPTFFYLEDFKYDVNEYISFDYTGKMMAVLRRDILEYISSELKKANLPSFLSVDKALLNNYKVANNLKNDEQMPSTLHIKGSVNGKEVVVGPMGFEGIFGQVINEEANTKLNFLSYVNTLYIDEGVKELTFFALNNAQNLKNLYLPSTLEECSISSLSNLNLDYLYIANTEKNINFVDLGSGNMPGFDGIEFHPAIYNTKINNSLVFKDYSNINLSNFPYKSIKISEDKELKDIIKISKDNEIVNYSSLDEAMNDFDVISLQYMFDLSKNKSIHTGSLKTIEAGKTLFIDQDKEGIYSINDAYKRSNNTKFMVNESNFSSCLVLDDDLTIKGNVIVGANIGLNDGISGVINGNYGSIDLNGHNLIIDGGTVTSYGLIFDSKLDSDSTNGIVIKESGELATNLGIEGYFNNKNAFSKLDNNINTYQLYTLKDIRSNIYIDKKGKLTTYTRFYDNLNQEFKNTFIGENGFIDNSGCSISRTYLNGKENYIIQGDASINQINISKDTTSKNVYYPLVNKYVSIKVDGKLILNQKAVILPDGELTVKDLLLNENLFVSEKNNIDSYSYYLNLDAKNDGVLKILNTLSFKDNNVGLNGVVTSTSSNFNNLVDVLKSNGLRENTYIDGALDNSSKNFINIINQKKYIKLTDGSNLFSTDNFITYYEFDEINKTGKLVRTSDSTILGNYDSSSIYWNANVDGSSLITYINKEENLNSFDKESKHYALINGVWNTSLIEDSNHIYTIDSKKYIKFDSKYVEGNLSSYNIFTSSDNKSNYIYSSLLSSWVELEFYENGRIAKEKVTGSYYYLTSTSFKPCQSYDEYNHYFVVNSKNTVFIKDTYETYSTTNTINDNSDGSKIIYLSDSGRNKATVYNYGKAIVDSKTYYYVDSSKRVECIDFKGSSYSEYKFIHFSDGYSYQGVKYYYALSEVNSSSSTRYTNSINFFTVDIDYSKIELNQENYSEVWDNIKSQVPDAYKDQVDKKGSFLVYRHFKQNDGKNYLYYKDSDGNISKKCFTFASGFVPEGTGSGSNILTKFNFLRYDVIFEGEIETRTLYMGLDAVGGFTDSENYIALSIFNDESPVNELIKGI